jgi:hypothetical protein
VVVVQEVMVEEEYLILLELLTQVVVEGVVVMEVRV